MKPLFFGKANHQLFGAFHPAQIKVGQTRLCSDAILLCYPGVQEYNTNHLAFRRIASSLAAQGCPVLRFDYFGTGDSMGRLDEASPSIWVDDIRQAAHELSDMTGSDKLSIIGMRLGASLAYLACKDGLTARKLILWEPVLRGRNYINQLRQIDRHKNLVFLHSQPLVAHTACEHPELFGYRWPSKINAEVEAIDLLNQPVPAVRAAAVITSWSHPDLQRLMDRLSGHGIDTSIQEVSNAESASPAIMAMRETNVLSNDVLQAITRQLSPQADVAIEATKSSRNSRLLC